MNPRCVILSGPSGSGKSTIGRKLTAGLPRACWSICSADDYFVNRGQGVYDFDPKLLPLAHKECWLNFIAACAIRVPLIIVDNTNIEGWEISPYYTHAGAMGYDVSITKLVCDSKVAAGRNLHGVPAKSVESMARRHGKGWPHFWNVVEEKTS